MSAAERPLVQFDAKFLADPDAAYSRLQAEAPVHRALAPDGAPFWLVTRHEDVRSALADPRFALNKTHAGTGYRGFNLPAELDANLLNMDAPEHTRLRPILGRGFTRGRIEGLRPRIREIADELLDVLPTSGPVDLLSGFAAPLPIAVICELLGVPAKDRPDFRTWTDHMLAPPQPEDLPAAVRSLWTYLLQLTAAKREDLGNDLISALIGARDDDNQMSEAELISALFLILGAGYENVTHVLGNGIAAVLDRPDTHAELRAHPELLPSAAVELVRFASPVLLAIRRFPTCDVVIGGTTIPAGDTVMLAMKAADRDPARFDDPDVLDVRRADSPHVGFGLGPHYCIGAPLARIEIEIALAALLERFPTIALATPYKDLQWRPSFRNMGLLELPVSL